ncbi:hypothetical protein SAMN05421770_104337 [Granulicella rosea]|uniref:Uncharacterized protein n=1 Tax=Granulicella rosea TaxID=474952 RepID=A0A239K6Y7_9BACT|nr:hypothetical protein [Granulicella rosea]SNT13771.1 hypothetical protein SAMN05421770_104337 [Granulicella rosea]
MEGKPLEEALVRSIERDIDAAFRKTLGITGLWKSTLRSAALDIMEELLTGHGTTTDASSVSLKSYSLNVVNGCNVLLRQIEILGSDTKTVLPPDLEARMKRAIAASSLYTTVEDAYTSYSRGYAKAVLLAKESVCFDTPGTELDARLRFFGSISSSSDRIADKQVALQLPDLMVKEHGEKMVQTLLNSKIEQMGGLQYSMDKTLLHDFSEGYRSFFADIIEMPMNTVLGDTTLDGVVRAYSMLCAASHLHKWITVLSKPPEMQRSPNWPSLWRQESAWKQLLAQVCPIDQVDALVDLFLFDPNRLDADVSLTPFVNLGEGYLALSPTAVLRSNFPRNVLALLIRKFPNEYSTYTSGREKALLASAKDVLGKHWIGAGVQLPKWKGKQLPDVDLLLGGPDPGKFVVCEVKWQLSGSSTREVINRDEYLRKGLHQLEQIREFLIAHPSFLKDRGLTNHVTTSSDFEYVLLCKGHLGSETVQSDGILKCDYDVFCRSVTEHGVLSALTLARDNSYLPKLGVDFTLEPISVRFGRWRLSWWTLLSVALPEDDETNMVTDFYIDSAEFLQ